MLPRPWKKFIIICSVVFVLLQCQRCVNILYTLICICKFLFTFPHSQFFMFSSITSSLMLNINLFWIAQRNYLQRSNKSKLRFFVHGWLVSSSLRRSQIKSAGIILRKKLSVLVQTRTFPSLQINTAIYFQLTKGKWNFDVCKNVTCHCLSHNGCHSDIHPVGQRNMRHQKRLNGQQKKKINLWEGPQCCPGQSSASLIPLYFPSISLGLFGRYLTTIL